MRYQKSGFSLLELLIILGVTASLLGIAGLSFAKQRQKGDLTRATQVIGQDIRFARSKALSQSTSWRFRPVDHKSYVLEEWHENTANWTIVRNRTIPGKARLASETIGGLITFDSRGFADIVPAELKIRIGNNISTQQIITSMTGNLLIMDATSN